MTVPRARPSRPRARISACRLALWKRLRPRSPSKMSTKVFGTPVAGDKSESPKPSQIHPATLVGHAPAARPGAAPSAVLRASRGASGPRRRPRAASPRARARAPSGRRAPATRPTWPTRSPRALRTSIACRRRRRTPRTSPRTPAPFDAILAARSAAGAAARRAERAAGPRRRRPSLRATVMPERAVLSIDTGTAGELRAAPAGQGRRRRRARHRRRRRTRCARRAARRAGERGADAGQLRVRASRAPITPAPRKPRPDDDRRLATAARRRPPAAVATPPTNPHPPRPTGRGVHVTA